LKVKKISNNLNPRQDDKIDEESDEDKDFVYKGTKFYSNVQIEKYKSLIGEKINLKGFSCFSDDLG